VIIFDTFVHGLGNLGKGAVVQLCTVYVNILYLQIRFEITSGDWQMGDSISYWQVLLQPFVNAFICLPAISCGPPISIHCKKPVQFCVYFFYL
jgi:hypothetical protein